MKPKIVFYDRNLSIPDKSKCKIFYYGELMYIKFDKPYCIFYFTKKRIHWIKVSLKEIADKLPEAVFLKCQRSVIINLCYLKGFDKNPLMVEMVDGTKFELTKQNRVELDLMLGRLKDIAPPCPICYPCLEDKCERQALFCKRLNVHDYKEPEKE